MGIREAIARLVDGISLEESEAEEAMRDVVEGAATPAQIAALAIALRMKGETAPEIAGLARVMRDYATRVHVSGNVADVVGTGGDGAHTFNISTLSSFVVAAAGGKVAKHGNRGVTSGCGSADILEALGVAIELPPDAVAVCVEEVGMGFMFAPLYHPAMRHAVGPRREIGVRTIFNVLGPLTNPAAVRYQLTGVASSELGPTMAQVLGRLGAKHALVVHGHDGVDELSISASSDVHEVVDGQVHSYQIDPEEMGLCRHPANTVRGGTVEANLALAKAVLDGEEGAPRDAVLLNAGAALYTCDLAGDIREGVQMAAEAIDSGRAWQKVRDLVRLSQRLKQSGSPGSQPRD